jgi:hypothetical protein
MSVLDTKEEPGNLGPCKPKDHHAVIAVLGTGAEANDPDLHHHGTTIAHDMEEAEDPNLQDTHTTTKMTK